MKRRIAAILLSALLASLHVACFSKPEAPQLGGGSGSGSGSGGSNAAMPDAPAGCTAIHDDFAGTGSACGDWGDIIGEPTLRSGGVLYTSPSAGSGGCKTKQAFPFASTGTAIEILALAAGGMQYATYFAVYGGAGSAQGARVEITLSTTSASVSTYCVGGAGSSTISTMYSVNQRWWRMKPGGSGSIVVEAGSDGTDGSYAQITTCDAGLTASDVKAEFGVANVPDTPSTAAEFDEFSTTCPP